MIVLKTNFDRQIRMYTSKSESWGHLAATCSDADDSNNNNDNTDIDDDDDDNINNNIDNSNNNNQILVSVN
eukprot:scaffold554884_cov16-Prasinocladus_malaysianus.AAC.2